MRRNILLVDDDHIFQFLSKKIFQRAGVTEEIHTASSGPEALNLITAKFSDIRSLIDYIFIDINMPVMDGFGFIEAFRKLKIPNVGNTKLVIVTSSEDNSDIQRAKDMGIEHYLVKPITEKSIRSVIGHGHTDQISG